MRQLTATIAVMLAAVFLGDGGYAGELTGIVNYREYSARLSSSGQPDEAGLRAVRDAGFERVIFLALSDSEGSLANEDSAVRGLGMAYAHIPVVWESPTLRDFAAFAAVMQSEPALKTLVHCQVNYRGSAFSFLYRVIYEGVPIDEAKDDMNTVWVPNATWQAFIFDVLEKNGRSPHCDGCLWESE